MSAVEETLERIKSQPGIEGCLICDRDGVVLRRMPSMPQEEAERYSKHLRQISSKARHLVRDLDPKDDLRNLRIRTKKKEIIVSHDQDFMIIVVQQWQPYSAS